MQTTVFFIRHGESKANEGHIFQGHSIDTELTEKGRKQAKEIKEKLDDTKIDAVYCSPKKRCTQTAEIIFGKKYVMEKKLVERCFGEWEGKSREQVKQKWPENYARYKFNRDMGNVKGAERFEEFEERVKGIFKEILSKNKGKSIAIVSHGGPGKVLARNILKLPREQLHEMKMENASLMEIIFSGTSIETGKIKQEIGKRTDGEM